MNTMTRKQETYEEEGQEEAVEEREEAPVGSRVAPKVTDLPGVGAATAEKLSLSGFEDVMSIAVSTPGELVNAAGVSEVVARKMIRSARDALDMGFQSGIDLLRKRETVHKIKTGSKAFDDMLDGGFETGAITECFGQYGSGKCVAKDTTVFYLNSSKAHLETIEVAYEKYKERYGERPYDGGMVVQTPPVEVMGLTNDGIRRTKAEMIYKEKVDEIYEIRTKRGRLIKVTGPHKLLSFDDGMLWKPAALLKEGDVLAYPKELSFEADSSLSEDDAYFLGLFAAEGGSNPFAITTGSEVLRDWLVAYVEGRFRYVPAVGVDNRREKPVFSVLLRKRTKEIMGGLESCKAGVKFVPEDVLSGTPGLVSAFLAGYLDGDGSLEPSIVSMTTKSADLATGLSYLFSRIGIAVSKKERTVNGSVFHVLTVCGPDRKKVNDFPFRLKSVEYLPRNSSYGYGKPFVRYVRQSYRETLGGNRGSFRKPMGKKATRNKPYYGYLHSQEYGSKAMGFETIKLLGQEFVQGKQRLHDCVFMVESLSGSPEDMRKVFELLPFAYNDIAQEIGLSKPGLRNYLTRGVPQEKVGFMQEALLRRLNDRISRIDEVLATIKNALQLHWDEIVAIEKVPYHDYVYDFVVPEGHSFVGGAIPLVMHNTQVGHALAVNVQVDDPDAVAVYIDTENTFRPERIAQFARGAGLDTEKVLRNIKVARAFNSDHQMLLAEKVDDLVKQGLKVRLVVVDSLTAHFRAEFVGRGTLAERQQKLNKHMHVLSKFADMHNACVYVTNQVMAKPDQFFGDPTEAIGGHIVGHNCIEENSVIYTPSGLMRMKSEPKQVFTFSQPSGLLGVQKAREYSASEKGVKRIFANNIIEATDNHRFPVWDVKSGRVVYRLVKELSKGDHLVVLKRAHFEGEYQPFKWNGLSTHNNHVISKPSVLTENTAYLLGVILGDGNIDNRSIGIRNEHKEDLELVNNLFHDVFSVNGTVRKISGKNAYELRINSKELVNNLDIKHNKDYFLNLVSRSPSSVRMAFVSGLIDTDGSLQREIDISQSDKSVLDYVQGLLLFEGIQSVVREQKNVRGFSRKDGLLYHLRIRSSDCKVLAEKLVLKYRKRIGLAKYLVRRSKGYYKTHEWGDFMTFPITRIEDGGVKRVIDLNVDKDHTFVVNGIASHNSTFRIYLRRGKKGTRVAKLVDAPNLADAECVFMVAEGGILDA